MLTIEQLRRVNIPLNVSNKPNNLRDYVRGTQLYNDSINLLEAIELVGGSGSSVTNLGSEVGNEKITITSSTGTGVDIFGASDSDAGLLTAANFTLLQSALQEVAVDSSLTGTGTISDPLAWAGAWVDGPITGSGTEFFPLTILNNSITTAHIQAATILFSDWAQNGATAGQVPQWTGSGWAPATVALPSGAVTGDTILFDGSNWQAVSEVTETKSNIASVNLTLAATPLTYGTVKVFKNGYLQTYTNDYTRSGSLITFVRALKVTDVVTIIYYL